MTINHIRLGVVALGLLVGCGSGGAAGSGRGGARSANEAAAGQSDGAVGQSDGLAAQETADRCVLRGREELAARHYAEAERRLEIAWDVDARAEIAADLGRAEVGLGKLGEAGAHLSAALDGGASAVEAQLSELRSKLGSVALQTPRAGAQVSVFVDDWRASHRLPKVELWLAPGKHEVELRVGAKVVAKRSIDVEIGKRVDWQVEDLGDIDADIAAQARAGGTLGAAGGLGVAGGLGAGGRLNADGRLDPDLNAKVPSASSGLSTPLIVVGSIVGAAAIGIGTGLAVAASNLSADAGKIEADLKASTDVEFPCQGANRAGNEAQCALLEAKLKDQEIFLGVGIPLLVTAGLVVGGGLTYIFWPRAKAPEAKVEICGVTVRPSVGPGSFSLQGTF